ncbi:MAG: hypothetical protein QOF02_1949 [Blastocatellia bacterium]|jgi:hypothetical protein|nr:hypothetical protein [Blastocatellia bacterium]
MPGVATKRAKAQSKTTAEKTAEKVAANPWMQRLARFGYAAKGVVYIVIGALATLAATGYGGETTDTRGALQTIETQPFGKAVLVVIAVGLVGYALWRLIQALADTEDKGAKLKGIAVRIGYACSGLVYAGMSLTAARTLIEAGEQDSTSEVQQRWTERLMSLPYGSWLVELAGACVVGFGLYQIYKGWRAKFRKRLKLGEMGKAKDNWATWSGRFGYGARGVVFILVGVFLIQAARHYNPAETKGLDEVLSGLARQAYGPWLLGVIAAGLVSYGFYMLVEARYRRINGS